MAVPVHRYSNTHVQCCCCTGVCLGEPPESSLRPPADHRVPCRLCRASIHLGLQLIGSDVISRRPALERALAAALAAVSSCDPVYCQPCGTAAGGLAQCPQHCGRLSRCLSKATLCSAPPASVTAARSRSTAASARCRLRHPALPCAAGITSPTPPPVQVGALPGNETVECFSMKVWRTLVCLYVRPHSVHVMWGPHAGYSGFNSIVYDADLYFVGAVPDVEVLILQDKRTLPQATHAAVELVRQHLQAKVI